MRADRDDVRVDAARFGRSVRALRLRRGWRQADLAASAGVSRGVIARIEQGRGDRLTVRALEGVARALDATLAVRLAWRGEELDRLLDAAHAGLVERVVRLLAAWGWRTAAEATYSVFGERGAVDVLAYHPGSHVALAVEVKTVIPDVGEMLRRLDAKARLAPELCRERGWSATSAGRLLVVADSSTARRRVAAHGATFGRALPVRGAAVRAWLHRPGPGPGQGLAPGPAAGPGFAGLWFVSSESEAVIHRSARARVRPSPSATQCRIRHATVRRPHDDRPHPNDRHEIA